MTISIDQRVGPPGGLITNPGNGWALALYLNGTLTDTIIAGENDDEMRVGVLVADPQYTLDVGENDIGCWNCHANFLGLRDGGGNYEYTVVPGTLSDDATLNIPDSIANDTFAFLALTQTFTNKRITKRQTSEASSATPTINTDNVDVHVVSALAAAITSMTTNLSGTPTDKQCLQIWIKDNGTARAIAWGASFQSFLSSLPTTTVLGKWLVVSLQWLSADSKWCCMDSYSQA